jgi:hypothetical protein
VAKRRRDFACPVEGDELDVQIFGFFEREHRVLAAGHDNPVKSFNVDVTYRTRFFNETCIFGCVNEVGRAIRNRQAIWSSSNLPRLRLRLRPVWVDDGQLE